MKKFFCYILSAFAVFLVFTGCTKDEENLNGTIAGLVTSGATSMILGGQLGTQSNSAWSDPMKLDNVRIYGVALSDEEVAEIYASEIK